MRLVLSCCFLMLLLLPVGEALAATQYVSDVINITLRRGPGTEYKILKSLRTGDRVEVLEEGEQYFQVRAQDGTEGYVLKRYLTSELPKSIVIARLNRANDQLKSRVKELETAARGWAREKEELQRRIRDVQQAFQGEKSKRQQVAKSYENLQEGARNVTELLSEKERLQTENAQQAAELNKLREENENLLGKALFKWFLAGAGVLFVGWIMGKRSRPKKRGF